MRLAYFHVTLPQRDLRGVNFERAVTLAGPASNGRSYSRTVPTEFAFSGQRERPSEIAGKQSPALGPIAAKTQTPTLLYP